MLHILLFPILINQYLNVSNTSIILNEIIKTDRIYKKINNCYFIQDELIFTNDNITFFNYNDKNNIFNIKCKLIENYKYNCSGIANITFTILTKQYYYIDSINCVNSEYCRFKIINHFSNLSLLIFSLIVIFLGIPLTYIIVILISNYSFYCILIGIYINLLYGSNRNNENH